MSALTFGKRQATILLVLDELTLSSDHYELHTSHVLEVLRYVLDGDTESLSEQMNDLDRAGLVEVDLCECDGPTRYALTSVGRDLIRALRAVLEQARPAQRDCSPPPAPSVIPKMPAISTRYERGAWLACTDAHDARSNATTYRPGQLASCNI